MRYENIKTSQRLKLKQQRMVFLSKVTSSSSSSSTTSKPADADESAKERHWLAWETYHIICSKLTYPT